MVHDSIQQKFMAALDTLVDQVKVDQSVLAALLCGSLSHDIVWTKSDIDLVLVTVDDKKVEQSDLSLYADGVSVHAMLIPRTEFRKMVEGSVRNSFTHSFLTKGRLLYTHDPTIADLCATLADIGRRDQQVQLLRAAAHALPAIDKAHKWLVTRGDLNYTALWILYAATPLAQVEVIGAGYLAERAAMVFGSILDHLRDVGEARSCREIEDHFKRNFDIGGVTTACEYLADQELIGTASAPTRLTKRSNVEVQELAFFYIGHP